MARPAKAKALERIRSVLGEIPELTKLSHRSPEPANSPQFKRWRRDARVAIANTFGDKSNHVGEFQQIRFSNYSLDPIFGLSDSALREAYFEGLESATSLFESMIDEIEKYWEEDDKSPHTFDARSKIPKDANKVFVVHGHDESVRETVARFLERLELRPVVLHEQPNQGRTIIEKFEDYADVGFAVVLLTPDDVGAPAPDKDKLKPRARQNVILELGFFLAELGRERVCPLVKGDLETPSDYHGVVYVPLDDASGWKLKLVQELKAAGFDIDANRAFGP